jgi:hypothetical protein
LSLDLRDDGDCPRSPGAGAFPRTLDDGDRRVEHGVDVHPGRVEPVRVGPRRPPTAERSDPPMQKRGQGAFAPGSPRREGAESEN